jgi:hypothetical protein
MTRRIPQNFSTWLVDWSLIATTIGLNSPPEYRKGARSPRARWVRHTGHGGAVPAKGDEMSDRKLVSPRAEMRLSHLAQIEALTKPGSVKPSGLASGHRCRNDGDRQLKRGRCRHHLAPVGEAHRARPVRGLADTANSPKDEPVPTVRPARVLH